MSKYHDKMHKLGFQFHEEEYKKTDGKKIYSFQLDHYGCNVYLIKTKEGYILKQTRTCYTTHTENIIFVPDDDMKTMIENISRLAPPPDKERMK